MLFERFSIPRFRQDAEVSQLSAAYTDQFDHGGNSLEHTGACLTWKACTGIAQTGSTYVEPLHKDFSAD